MSKTHAVFSVGILLGISMVQAHASTTSVDASLSIPVAIATLEAGHTYDITASGIIDLDGNVAGGKGLTFTADGKPTYDFSAPYSSLYPNGSDTDPSNGDSCTGGPGKLCGALIGTFTASPTQYSDYFMIGEAKTITVTTNKTLYGLVNDDFYSDNTGSFSVNVTTVLSTVPLPASAPMFGAALVALSGLGYAAKRKTKIVA